MVFMVIMVIMLIMPNTIENGSKNRVQIKWPLRRKCKTLKRNLKC